MAKFSNQEEKMADLEKLRQETIYEADRKFVVEKDK